jgi:hypothetical protein
MKTLAVRASGCGSDSTEKKETRELHGLRHRTGCFFAKRSQIFELFQQSNDSCTPSSTKFLC